ncbi:hypothetical protein BGX31_010309 [Mortierella sp. GBA43]|nr:hypothetical protein BGX31_010309 [Mortierella sp. GBA43]
MSLFNASEQRYFSQFLDALVGDQEYTFDPSAIPNLPNLNLFQGSASSGATGGAGASMPPPPMPMGMGMGFPPLEGMYPPMGPPGSVAAAPGNQQEMDFDMSATSPSSSSFSNINGQPGNNVTGSAKRSKTNKATGTDGLSPRTGTPLNAEGFGSNNNNKLVTPIQQLSKLSLENTSQGNNGQASPTGAGSSLSTKGKKNKREKEEVDEDEIKEEAANGTIGSPTTTPVPSGKSHHHRSSMSSSTSRATRENRRSSHERNNSVSDDYASDGGATSTTTTTNNSNHANTNGSTTTANGTSSSATAKRKPYKELLTEEEKRANHIASEQKRRNTIRNGFKDMVDIIPDLRDVNSSKSTILFKAVDFIKQLEKRNRGLLEKANQLEARLQSSQRNGVSPGHGGPSLPGGGNGPFGSTSGPMQPHMSQSHQPYIQLGLQQQALGMHYLPHQLSSQQHALAAAAAASMHHQSHHPLSYHAAGLDDKRLQDIPSIYPVAISR